MILNRILDQGKKKTAVANLTETVDEILNTYGVLDNSTFSYVKFPNSGYVKEHPVLRLFLLETFRVKYYDVWYPNGLEKNNRGKKQTHVNN